MMKKIFLTMLFLAVLACKNDKKAAETDGKTEQDVQKLENKENILSTAIIPEMSTWFNNGIIMEETEQNFEAETVILMSREDATKSAYSGINNIKINNGSTYKFSFVVKKADVGKNFALRMQGVYPNRVDAVFDLEMGIVKESIIIGEELAENNKAIIEPLGDGWYRCSLYADVYVDYVRLVFGPTTNKLKTGLWETRTGEKSNAFIVPTSLILEEL